ncbi:MAG: AraC family transcriptional regulator [Pseudomonadota bacterium]
MSHALAVLHGAFGRAALYRLDRPFALHAHREGHLIFLVEGTPARVSVSGHSLLADRHRGAAINPWEPHDFQVPSFQVPGSGLPRSALPGSVHPGAQPAEVAGLYLVLYLKPLWFLDTARTPARSSTCALNFGRPEIETTPRLRARVLRLAGLLLGSEAPTGFDDQLFDLTRACYEQSWRGAPASAALTAKPHVRDFRVRKAISILEGDLGAGSDMGGVARQAGLSRPHFFKLFKKHTGLTPNLYLNTLRSEAAIDDLRSTAKSVTAIAEELGFASQASFTRFFTCNVGIPPSDYRRVAATAPS